MISNSGFNSILKNSVHGTESTNYSVVNPTDDKTDKDKNKSSSKNKSSRGSFESINSIDIGLINSNKCFVCSKNFTLRKKHFCKFCQNAVCSDHSSRTRKKTGYPEPQRICDVCEQEEAKNDINNEIKDEVSKLNEELAQSREVNERLNRDYFEKTSTLNNLDKKLTLQVSQNEAKLAEIRKEANEQMQKAEKTKAMLDFLRKNLEDTKLNEEEVMKRCSRSEEEIVFLENKAKELKCHNESTATEIELISAKVKNGVNIENLSKSLCQRCSNKLNEAFNKIKSTSYWLVESADEEKSQKDD